MDDNIKKLHQALIDDGYDDVGTEQEFRDYVSDSKNVATLYNALSEAGYDNFKDQKSLETYLSGKAPAVQKPSTPQSSGQSVSSQKKEQSQYPQEVIDAFNSPDNKPGNFKDLAQLNDEYQRGELKKPGLISQVLGMMPKVDAGNIGKEQKMGGMISNLLLGDNMQQPQQTQQPQDNNQQVQQQAQKEASPESKEAAPVTTPTGVVNNGGLMDAKLANYLENWKQRPDKQGTYFENMVADLLADGTANSNEEAVKMVQSALGRYANRSAMDVTNQVVSSLPDDTVQDAEQSIEAQWYSHGVQDKLKQEADNMGISYDDYVAHFLKPAMVQSLVNKYGPNYRNIAEGIATRLYSHDEHVQDRLMKQDIDEALLSVISKYVNPSVVEEYNKAQEEGSKAFNEGMEGSQYIPANLRLGTALGAQYEANQAKDPQKILSRLMVMNYNMLSDSKFRLKLAEAATNVALKYHRYGEYKLDPDRINGLVLATVKNELDQLEIKGMMPKGSAEYIMKTGLGNTIVGKITRKIMQTDYQNWLEDIANQQYQPGFWENVASGALTFAGDAWSYWLPGAAGGKLTKSMVAKAEGKLAGDLMAKGMERKMAERAAKVLIGKSKAEALKSGAVHGAVTFGGQSAISKPIDETYRTGQFDENGKIYNPSVGKVIANTLGEVAKQSAVGAIMQGGTIANMVGKGRGLATNILADIGGKVADSGIMTGHQILERMAQDPNFKPTGKEAVETFLESGANLLSIGFPGFVGKYARFKDAREFNKKFDFTDQDIAELKRFGYDGLRDAFEKVGIGEYAVEGENAQRLDGQLTQKYMDLMNDKSVPEVLKAKMMAVVEGKRPSSFSPVIDSEVYRGDDGKYYLETYNKDGGVIDRKEYSSHDAARNDEKKLEYEKTLGLASVLEGEFHNEFTQEHLEGLYNKAAQKYNMGEKLTDEDKAAVYLHQNAGAIKDIMDKQQKGIILTEEEQKQINAYRHYYDSALENSSVMREFVNTFEDSHGVARGTLRKALESKDKKYAPLVESYLKELYNSIELKREMKQTVDDLYNTAHGNEQKRIEQSGVEGEKPAAPVEGAAPVDGSAGGQESPVSSGPAPYQDRTNSVPSPSDANSSANSSAEVPPTEPPTPPVEGETASNESKSNAYVMGQNAYQNGDVEGLKAIDHNDDVSKARLKRAFADNEAMMDVVVKAYEEGKDMEQFVAQRANSMTTAQQDAVRKYVEAQDAKKGVYDALQHADDGYGDALKELLWTYQTEDGNIVPATLTTGLQVFLKKANEYGGGFVVVPDEDGNPAIKQVSSAEIKEVGTPIPMDDYINQQLAEQVDARYKQFRSQFDGSGFKRGDIVSVSMEAGDEPSDVKIVGYTEDGRVILTDTDVDVNSQIDPNKLEFVTKDEFNAWRQNAIDTSVGAELDAEDAQRANDDAAKAEADKKQRYNEGIVGLGMGQPDYSSKDTEPKVAAEYLQEQFGNDHGKLINLISGSRSDIKEQLDNKRKAASEYEDWLSLNADLDPEKAQKVENDLALVNEQIADLETRYKNWNAIRKEVMTPEEARTLKNERKAEIEKAGVDENAITSADEREVAVLDNKELKKQYPTMDEASNYIASERKRIYHIQNDEVQPQIDGINEALEQYMNDDIDYSADQLKELNTTKAQLEARQANLTESAKELKAQADKLKKLYVQENKKERAAILAEMTPAEQRRVKAEQYLKDGNISGLMKLYGDTSVDFTDNHPNTVDEYVATSIGRFTLNYEGREVDGTFLNGLQQELGGSRKDFDKKQILAAEGKGQTFDKFVNDLYDNLPDNLRNQGVNTQEIRNSLLALLRGAEKYSDLKNYILKDKIAKAEEEMRPMDLAEEEQRIAYEENENVPLDKDTKSFDVANSLSAKVGQSLSKEEADNLVAEMEERAEPVRDLELTPDNWLAEFGEDGKVTTPLGEVKMGENQLAKLFMKGREAEFGLIKPTLSEPDVVIEETSHASTGEEERPSSYLFVKTFERDGKKIKFYASVSVKHDGMEVVISNHFMNKKAVDKKMQEGKMLYIKGASTSNSSDNHLAEHQNGVPDLLPTQEVDALNSESKDTNNFGNLQENSENFSERLKNAIAETETEPTEAQKKAGNYKKGHLSFGGYDFTVETPKGAIRSGKDEQGKPWSVTMHDTYGYILGKIGVDGDHIDMFINDAADLDSFDGNVYVVDQVNPETGEFDEHKVMYGYPDEAAAITAYSKNYSPGWKGLGKITSVPKATFDKWMESSDRKTKPFRDYAMIQHEEAKKAKQANEALPFGAPMSMDDLPFHRDVKEVKPSEMTEAQKVAYDAVSTMLKKAGIPVKVVSNEDMEKVAEAQDNLNLAMLLNQPEMRFKIKTPEEKQAAENAYNFAKELRPDKWKQYAVVDMSNPNKMPEYFEKQELARKERSYYNKLMWGNYKVFNLNKSFEDNVAGLTGSFPSEFDPYKIDAQTSKKNELKKQMKETEEAYKSTGQERKEYQNQLMKEYMDEHGLASENDIPDDVWSDLNDKAHKKYQDKLDSLFAKYKDLDRQLKAIVQPGVRFLRTYHGSGADTKFAQGKGVVYGYTDGKEIVLNQEHLNPNTPIHEYQHLWRTAAKNMNPELIEHGDKLIMQTQLFADLKEDPNYKHLSDEQICDEAFARLTGDEGEAILEQMAKDAIKENPLDTAKELSVINKLKEWLKKFWYWTLETFTKWKPEDIKKMTLEDIRNLVLRDLAQGVDPRTVLKGQMTKDEAVSLRQQMADNAEPERILEHTEDNWLQDFGKDGRVNTPIGSIKLGENQYKKAGREDRIKRFGLLKPTLERPDVILEKPAPKEGAERQTKYLFVKSFKKVDGTKILNFESITVKQGEDEVSISAHQIEPSKLLKELTESKMLWNRFRGDSNSLGENQGSALTPSANNPSGKDSVLNPHSDAKIRNSFEITKENGGKLSVEDKIKAVSQQFGVDEADVAMYANAIKKGSTAEAARARANIKRHLMQVNEGNIFSFKDVVKYTKPINEALKVNFGDLDAMIEERRKQVEAERNAMEAARKRAEEEEAKRKKHLEELSLIPEDKLDKQYMDALAKGDDATAREMLDEAARRKGYDDTESAYQGVGAWAAPGNPGYESDKARRDDWESSGSDVNLEDMALGYTPQPDDYFSHPERYSQNTPHGLESVKAINTAIDAIKNGEKDVKVKVYRAVPTSVKEGKLRNGDWVTPSKKYAEKHGTNRLEGKYRIIEDEVPATQLWWDGNDANEFGFDDGKAYKYKNAKNNRKLNDLVTYDDEGDVIPPSKRFNSRKSDIRFMFAGEKGAAEADKADEQTIRMDNLDVATQMEKAKKDAKIIKMATGWEKGVDGKWRYEMPDAKIKDTIDVGGGNIVKRFEEDMLWTDGKLEDAVDAPKLFEAYPQLKNIKIHTDAVMNDMPSNGEYNPQTKTITIHADELKYLNSILNHEIQHVIQREEGFAHGGTPEQVERDFNAAKAEWKARSYAFELEEKAKEMGGEYNQSEVEKALIQEYKDMDMPEFIPDKETRIKGFNYFARGYADRSMDDAIKRFRLDRFQRTDFDSYQEYRKLAGEVESRNVEKRLGMTDEERRNSLASETEDVNRDEQIVMNGNDASYSIVKDPETIKKLDKEDTVKVYRAMQVGEDGKLYPPMAAKVKGKFVEPIELGKWEQADERPELADDKGMFTLNKGNGKSLKAAYNPYLHTSRTPLNDQFSEAQNRPNIVTVEVEVPKSELTSGYKADKAKDAVGEVEWKAGIIQGQLTGKRKVVLSRWDKPVRIVPDSEVADVIVNDMFKGKNITMPSNVVTPSLRKELEKRGVPFVETDNRGRIVGGENDGVHYSKVYGKNHREKGYRSILKFSLGDNGTDVADGNGDSINKNPNKNVITRRIGSREQAQRRVNETLGAAASDLQRSLGATAQEQRPTWNRRFALRYVRRRAEELSSFLTEKDLNEVKGGYIGHGQENYVYQAKYDPTKVIKFNDFGLTDSLFRINEFIDRVNAHNQFQPKDKYTPIGFAYDEKGDFCIVMEQPYLKGTQPTREEITKYLTDHGFKLDMIQISADEVDLGWTNGEFDLWDAEPRNVIKDENGDLHFFDTMIQHTYIPNHKNPLRLSMPSIRTFESQEMKDSADKVKNVANVLGGAEVTSYTNASEVPDEYKEAVEQGARGWYDPSTHTVHVYLPNCADADEAQRTVFHEKIGHEGMEVLLGGEQGVRKFADFVYKSVDKKTRGKILDFAHQYDPGWNNPDRINIGTQEYIAHLAEEGPKTAEDFSLWTKIKHYLIKVLKKLGVRVPGLLNDKDLRYYLMKAGKALHVWDEMPQEKQEALMKQASNAEIKDALSDGAGKGKPIQKKGESYIQYIKRAQEWRKWQNAREDKEDPEPPMFYDFDKDAEGKKEWERLNKEWRDSHHLQGDEMPIKPERKEGETDEAFFTRYKEWEKWNDAMADKENPMPDMFSFEKAKQDEARQKYEDWLTKHELNEQNNADLDLYEGKIYPAETNPKADALEQQVMQDLAEVTSTDVSKEGAAKTVKYAVIHRRKNMEEASADDAIYINDVKNRIEKMADSGVFDKLLSDYKGKANRAEKLAEAIPYIIEAPRRLRDLAHDLNATGAFDKGHIHIQPADVEAIQPFVADLIAKTAKKHTVLKDDKEVEVYDDPQAVSEVASKMAQAINNNHQGEEGFVPIDGTDILSEHVLPLVKQQIVPDGIDYKNLSPEMKATIDSIRDWYSYTYDWLKDNRTLREDTGYNADYVNHIWDKEKSDKQAYAMYVENRQRTKSPNEKPRTISTLMEGISVGLVPKTTDITKMMAYYSRSNIEAWANKTMLQEVSGLNVIERNEDGEIISSDPLLSSVAPFNLEQYKYFEIPGVGPVWVYNVSPKQMKVKNPITGKDKVLYSEASAGDRFGVVFDTYQSTPFWKAFDTLASSMKKLELGFSGFHAGALTEVYMVQNMVEYGPKKALANFMKYIFADTMKNHQLPCFANPQDFQEAATHLVKFGATNDYAAADVQNMFDNFRDSMMKVQEKLKDGNGITGTVALATMPLKVATQMLSLINKGMDRALWDFLHDGLKLATYRMRADKTKERAKKKGWTEEELSRALDEDGQFVNDMFGGQHWDVLGASHRTLRYAGRVLLSPDWNASTTRHFLALTGYGSVWNEATLDNFKQYYSNLLSGSFNRISRSFFYASQRNTRPTDASRKYFENLSVEDGLTPNDEGRRSRQISALLCYGIGFMVFYEAFANGINAAFRAMDEEKERKKAEEIRKTNPSYKSMYELAYGDEGMKWYDYLMRGNSLGQQSKIFLGRYADGTEMYIRHGKQFREVPEYLFNHKGELEFPGPMVQRMIGKANPMVRMTLDDINYLSDFQASHADQEIQRKYGKTIGLLYKDALYWAPFLIPSQENKEFKAVDFFFPSSKGFSPWKAQSYFKDFILSGDMEGVVMTYQSCQRNGIDPEAQIKAAIGSVKALESAEMQDGVTSLQEASKRFDAAKSITEKKKMRQKMKKFLSQSEYKAFTQKEALDMVQGYLNGDEDLKEMEKAESKYLMKAKAEDVREDWRIQNVWNGTMETYQEYQRLKDVDKAKANAFKNSKTNKRLFAARKAISAAKKKMNKAKKQMDGQNDAAKLVEIRKTRKELLETLNGME